ncbi:MAG: dihydroorotase [Bacteroidia bacterium]|nr:dihydroorotase [Bacteroidia bacterium]
MNILIKQATVIDSKSPYNGKKVDILIENGIITSIKSKLSNTKNVKEVEFKNLHLSPGWFEMQANFCDPGFEHKEDLKTGINAAINGGFTEVAVVPSTNPPIHTKAQVQYILNNTKDAIVKVHPVGTVSANLEGKELSEMYDMKLAGAIAFYDDKKSVANAGLLMRALLYSKNFNSLILTHCDDKSVSVDGQMNEGITSTKLGLKGIPALAEELMVARNVFLSEYCDAPIHLMNISTQKSVDLIKQAKAKKIKVTASVNSYNLVLEDSLLNDFDSNYKLNPPLRTKTDIDALRKGIADGVIDAITSDHRPQDIESKDIEFDMASNGMISLETSFAMLNTKLKNLSLEQVVNAMTHQPRAILGVSAVVIKEGELANITLFDPSMDWEYDAKKVVSKSKNSPFIGQKFKGKALGVINNNKIQLVK